MAIDEGIKVYHFGDFQMDTGQRLLLLRGDPVKLPAKAFDILLYFIEHRGQVIGRERLLSAIWHGTVVEDSNLTVHISTLRRILSEGGSPAKIETFPKNGYRFVGEVSQRPPDASAVALADLPDDLSPGAAPVPKPIDPERNGTQISKGIVLFSSLALLVLIAAGLLTFPYIKRSGNSWFQKTTIDRITNNGISSYAAISRDGKYIIYGRTKGNGRSFSLWLRVLGTTSETELLPSTEGSLAILTFLPDGKQFAYGLREPSGKFNVYVRPLFGGALQRLPIDSPTDISFSPDGSRLAYVLRKTDGSSTIYVAASDGSDPKPVAVRQMPNTYNYSYHPAWHPDGTKLACLGQNGGEDGPRLFEIDLETGAESPLTKETWTWITEFAWLPDGGGLLMAAASQTSSLIQIWRVSVPGGDAVRVTIDSASYFSLSLSGDGGLLVTSQRRVPNVIWTIPATWDPTNLKPNLGEATKISSGYADGISFTNAHAALSWTQDGRIVFTSDDAGNTDIWSMGADGNGRVQLTTNLHQDTGPAVSPNGRTVVFTSKRSGGEHLWTMNIDGSDQKQFSDLVAERQPTFSADGQWVYFTSMQNGVQSIWKKPAAGGEPIEVIPGPSSAPELSPDGTMLLFRDPTGFHVVPADGGKDLFYFKGSGRRAKWIPSSRGFTFLDMNEDAENVWIQMLDGSPRQPITNFNSDDVMLHSWSPDGTSLATARGTQVSDLVLISNVN